MFSVEDVLHIVCYNYLMESIGYDPSLDYFQQLLVTMVHMMIPIYSPSSLCLYTLQQCVIHTVVLTFLTVQFFYKCWYSKFHAEFLYHGNTRE